MLSVVIPTLNEQDNIQNCLASVYSGIPYEVIVVDGGSDDATGYLAKKSGARFLSTEKGLASQCNYGAESATGDVLFFLAADSQVEPAYREAAETILADPRAAAGGFTLSIDDPSPFFRAVEWGGNLRGNFFKFSLPDQGLFVRRQDFLKVGGMKSTSRIPFARLCDDLKASGLGSFMLSPLKAKSSPRKWKTHGIFKTCLNHNWVFLQQRLETLLQRMEIKG